MAEELFRLKDGRGVPHYFEQADINKVIDARGSNNLPLDTSVAVANAGITVNTIKPYDTSGGSFTLYAPGSPVAGSRFGVLSVSTSTNEVTISGNGISIGRADLPTLLGSSFQISLPNRALVYIYDGTNWLPEYMSDLPHLGLALNVVNSGTWKCVMGSDTSATDDAQISPGTSEKLSVVSPSGSVCVPLTIGRKGTASKGDTVGLWILHRDNTGVAKFAARVASAYVEDPALDESYSLDIRTNIQGNDERTLSLYDNRLLVGQGVGTTAADSSRVDRGLAVYDGAQGGRTFLTYYNGLNSTDVRGAIDWRLQDATVSERVAVRVDAGKDQDWSDLASTDAKIVFSVVEGGTLTEYFRISGKDEVAKFAKPVVVPSFTNAALPAAGTAGRVFFNSTKSMLVVDDGSQVGHVRPTKTLRPAQITADQDNYNPTGFDAGVTCLFLSSDVSRSLSGLDAGLFPDGEELVVVNVGGQDIVLEHQGVGSSAGNRFLFSDGLDYTLSADESTTLIRDDTASRWRRVGV